MTIQCFQEVVANFYSLIVFKKTAGKLDWSNKENCGVMDLGKNGNTCFYALQFQSDHRNDDTSMNVFLNFSL